MNYTNTPVSADTPSQLLAAIAGTRTQLDVIHSLISALYTDLSPVRSASDKPPTMSPATPIPEAISRMSGTPAGESLLSLYNVLVEVANRLITLRGDILV